MQTNRPHPEHEPEQVPSAEQTPSEEQVPSEELRPVEARRPDQPTSLPGGVPIQVAMPAVSVPPGVSPGAIAASMARTAGGQSEEGEGEKPEPAEDPTAMVGKPAKVMRIGTMVKQLLDEVRSAPLDYAARARLADLYARSVHELEEGLSPDLLDELTRLAAPFTDDEPPSDAELRIAQAQLVGWLEGLFHGIQTAIVAQQMAAQSQVLQARKALPGMQGGNFAIPVSSEQPGRRGDERDGPGQYL